MKIVIFGAGYIGLSTALYYAKHEIKSILVDIDQDKVNNINNGICPIKNLEEWLGIKLKPYQYTGYISATTDYNDININDIDIYFICINTEKNDEPYYDSLVSVLNNIKTLNENAIIIVESTLAPGITDNIIIPIIDKVCIAPRRDWFTLEYQKKLPDMPRVYGCTDDNITNLCEEVLSIVCRNLIKAPNHRYAEMTKSVENMLRHVHCVIAQQLSLAYPNININKVLELAGSKWNVEAMYASMRTGGYCIPLSSLYVVNGSNYPNMLTILNEVIKQDNTTTYYTICEFVNKLKAVNGNRVAILSLSYLGDVPVDILSPTNYIVPVLQSNNIKVGIHDPYFDDEYIKDKFNNVDTIHFPNDLLDYDGIIIVANNKCYDIPFDIIENYVKNCVLILDNHGVWDRHKENFNDMGMLYYRFGNGGFFK